MTLSRGYTYRQCFMWCKRVDEELEALQAILMDEIHIKTDDRGKAVAVETTVYPWTALDTQQQYVRVDLSIALPARYPDISPVVTLRNPRGLEDTTVAAIEAQIHDKCDDFLGQPVIYEIINLCHFTSSLMELNSTRVTTAPKNIQTSGEGSQRPSTALIRKGGNSRLKEN
ncbi:NF-kappaB binding [Homalodisca vitripennis]|nr:NF-kappaB binding [Homalodisca vitripennis]